MPELNSLDALELMNQKSPGTHLLFLAMHDDEGYLHEALARGESGYVLKQAAEEQLLNANRIVHQGGTYLHEKHRSMLFDEKSHNKAPEQSSSGDQYLLRLIGNQRGEVRILGYEGGEAALISQNTGPTTANPREPGNQFSILQGNQV